MNLAYLRAIREHEVNAAVQHLRALGMTHGRLLEVGAGAGWQSRHLAQLGYEVQAVDVAQSNYASARVWPVGDYDGRHLPFPDGNFDVLFTSNVLEHIPHLQELLQEMWRVVRIGGIALHIVPSGAWRAWTNVTYYPAKMIGYVQRWRNCADKPAISQADRLPVIGAMLPRRHGETGNALTEVVHFSKPRWRAALVRPGWKLEGTFPNGLLYTGNTLLGTRLSISVRERLSRVLGSSCHFFVLRKAVGPLDASTHPE
jgi:SAM-dependent methyltransferase